MIEILIVPPVCDWHGHHEYPITCTQVTCLFFSHLCSIPVPKTVTVTDNEQLASLRVKLNLDFADLEADIWEPGKYACILSLNRLNDHVT